MFFKPEFESEFLALFQSRSTLIRQFEGCRDLYLVKNTEASCAYTTISIWQSEVHLENYRQSLLFQETWALTKVGFAQRPVAVSYPIIWPVHDV